MAYYFYIWYADFLVRSGPGQVKCQGTDDTTIPLKDLLKPVQCVLSLTSSKFCLIYVKFYLI